MTWLFALPVFGTVAYSLWMVWRACPRVVYYTMDLDGRTYLVRHEVPR